jgi:hypothetical protein
VLLQKSLLIVYKVQCLCWLIILQSAHFRENKFIFMTQFGKRRHPALPSPAQAPHRADGPFKSGIVYCLLPMCLYSQPLMCCICRGLPQPLPLFCCGLGHLLLVHPILQTSGNDFDRFRGAGKNIAWPLHF